MKRFSSCLGRSVLVSMVMALATAGPVLGQDEEQPQEEVVVTGSRIAQPNQVSTSPVQVVTDEDIKTGGKLDITDVLNDLPQINSNSLGQDLGNRTSGLTSAGGVSTANLRGIGPNRTLVLVNGRRLGIGSPNTVIQSPAPDLDQIPSALLERVDVVTGGASAVYGSDAIAGVVNFITKKNFEGFQIDYQLGTFWHDNNNKFAQNLLEEAGYDVPSGNTRDGRTTNISLLAGTNFAEGRGNITAFFGYLKADGVPSGNRDFGGCQLNVGDDLRTPGCSGSVNSNLFTGPDGVDYQVAGNEFVPFGTADTSPPAVFNSQTYIYAGRQNERYNAGFMASYELNDRVEPYAEFMFMNDRSYQEIAPSALFYASNPLEVTGGYEINCINPFLSAQQRSILCTPGQVAADQAAYDASLVEGGPAYSPVVGVMQIGRRNIEGGGRSSSFEHTNFRAVGGIRGDIADGWNYDAYAQYYYTQFNFSNDNYLNFEAIEDSLIVVPGAEGPECASGTPCVPYNIFAEGGVSQDQIDPLYTPGTARGNTTLRITHADVTGDLGQYGIKLPSAANGVSVNVGLEHRSEEVFYKPDAASESGLLSGAGGASAPIDNGYSVDEAFIEMLVPLVADRPGIRELVFDAGYRYSDYSTAGGINTHKFELQYAPVDSLRFRASFQRAIRAPSTIELFNPDIVGQIQFGNDPCAPTLDDDNNVVPATATLEECERTGVTAAQYGNGGTTNVIPQAIADQLTQLQGGNLNLLAETGKTRSLGATFSPTFLPNLVGSIDYYEIELEGAVGVVPANVIMDNCLETGDPAYCSQLVRHPLTGGLNGATVASGGYIVQRSQNIAALSVKGIDVQTTYKMDIGERLGGLRFSLNGAYLLNSENTPFEGAHTYDCADRESPLAAQPARDLADSVAARHQRDLALYRQGQPRQQRFRRDPAVRGLRRLQLLQREDIRLQLSGSGCDLACMGQLPDPGRHQQRAGQGPADRHQRDHFGRSGEHLRVLRPPGSPGFHRIHGVVLG
jgi:iron complex outermembrane receptor protein